MTVDEAPIVSEEEFQAELQAILRQAHDNDLDVEGGWECRNGGEHPDWDVVVAEVRKTERDD